MYQKPEDVKEIKGYKILQKEYLTDIGSVGILYEHEKSGARVAVISNDDSNKVFSIGFRTPPADSTGVAHIVEHTVLCGSRRFPSKDPFVELVKGSLNTFLNAMTYPDKTVYPVASPNDKDFQNLMEVYLDAVFYPNIYKKEEIFKQEGWHYHLESEDGELKYNGVVYNEMKGVYSSPDSQVDRMIQQSLFPESTYGQESGGAPQNIPDLTYEEYLSFHKKYYHPSNSYIYLYGDMDVEEKLSYMDAAYLSDFSRMEIDSEIGLQKPFAAVKTVEGEYAVSEEEKEAKSYLSYNTVIGTSLDREAYVAYQILEYVLFSSAAAPVKQRLVREGLGSEVSASYDNGILQPVFSVLVKNAKKEEKDRFVAVLKEELEKIVKDGVDAEAIQGAVNYFEFKYREADFGSYPKGLIYGLSLFDSWLYDDSQPFALVKQNAIFAKMKEYIGTGYFERLIQEGILDNPHAVILVVNPKPGLAGEIEEAEKKRLRNYRETLDKEEIRKLVEKTNGLLAYQTEPDSEEAIAAIPVLSRSDIGKRIRPVKNKEYQLKDGMLLHHEYKTNGIAYLKLYVDVTGYEGYAPYFSLLTLAMGYMDCENYDFLKLSKELDLYTGGVSSDTDYFTRNRDTNDVHYYLAVRGKFLYENTKKALELMEELILRTKLSDVSRMMEIVAEARSRMEAKLQNSANAVAAERASSYGSRSALLSDEMKGLGYYRFLRSLEQGGEEKVREAIQVMAGLLYTAVKNGKLILSLTAEKEGLEQIRDLLPALLLRLKDCQSVKAFYEKALKETIEESSPRALRECEVLMEGLKTSGQVQFVARAGNYKNAGLSYTGELRLLRTILGYEYLWNQVRVKGGAYGCGCGFYRDGLGYFSSYRDPKLRETNEAYEASVQFLENFTADERAMTKYIIGTISGLDTPLTPSMAGTRSFNLYMSGESVSALQKERDQILSASQEDIRKLSAYVKAVLDTGYLCVVGNEKRIEENRSLFETIAPYV